jgi:AraC-like DNA-binding protein
MNIIARDSDFRVQKGLLWPGATEMPAIGSPHCARLLRMYAPDAAPQSGSLYMDDADVDTEWHYHDMHQLTYAFTGAVIVEDCGSKYVSVQNRAVWIPAGVRHSARIHGVKTVSVYFTKDQITCSGDRIRVLIVSPLLKEMMKEVLRWPLSGPSVPLRSFFIDTMALLSSEALERLGSFVLPTSNDPRMERALAYTVQRADARLSDVCSHAGMSERTFRRRMLAEIGMTWEAYHQLSRLLRGLSLLGETALPITEVAAECGFESLSAFSRAFRLIMQETPREYRSRLAAA